jgi:hypothetical protein
VNRLSAFTSKIEGLLCFREIEKSESAGRSLRSSENDSGQAIKASESRARRSWRRVFCNPSPSPQSGKEKEVRSSLKERVAGGQSMCIFSVADDKSQLRGMGVTCEGGYLS